MRADRSDRSSGSEMSTRIRLALLAGLALVVAPVTVAQDGEGYVGSETCEACHVDEVEAFRLNPHTTAPGWDTAAGCEGCHGPGAEHAESGDPATVTFETLSARESSGRCLDCHRREEKQFNARRGIHHLADVACVDCHSAHSTAPNLLDRLSVETCGGCHQGVVAQFALPRTHPLPETGRRRGEQTEIPTSISCEGCHEPHARDTPAANAAMGLAQVNCVKCHTEKAGPFLYPHDVSMVDGCQSCHQVHGSPNRHLLTHAEVQNLCYECHNRHSASSFEQKCTACHIAIHGSNTQPSFRER